MLGLVLHSSHCASLKPTHRDVLDSELGLLSAWE